MAAKTDAAGRRIKKAGEPPLARYADKDITPTMEVYVGWLKEQTGYDVDPMSVQLSGVLRGTFQKSDINQSRLSEAKLAAKAEAEARAARREERAARRAEREATATEKATAKPAAKAAPAARKAAAAKAPTAKATPAKRSAPAKPATTRRRSSAAAKETEADF